MWKTTSSIKILSINFNRGQFQNLYADMGEEQIEKLQIPRSSVVSECRIFVPAPYHKVGTKRADRRGSFKPV
jgi:hypothetical protein